MKQFFKYTLATVFGIFLSWILLLFVFTSIAASLADEDDTVLIEENSVLNLDLSTPINDMSKDDDAFAMLSSLQSNAKSPLQLISILNNIEKAKTDVNIKGITITNAYSNAGSAQLQEIRKKLLEFKESGKFIYAFSDIYNQKGYWVSTVADSILLNPVGAVEFKGLAAEIMFFKNFQDKYGIKFDVIRHGKFKSAVEPFLSNKMSDANRLQTTTLINSIWNTYLTDISKARNISVSNLNNIADNRLSNIPSNAVSNKLIDKLIYENDFELMINEKIGNESDDKINVVSMKKYTNTTAMPMQSGNQIAILYAEGEIKYSASNSSGDAITPKTMIKAIREIKDNDDIKAVVLRVNSPGGSALASDIIWHELEVLKQKKPLIVSFSNVAASGGYYIACGAEKIFAQPTTITGSIGVFGLLPNLEKAVNDIGITSEVVSTNKNAFEASVTRGASAEIKNMALQSVEETYKNFVNRVSAGRKMSFDKVDAIGQGRVWSAKDAVEIGLVDKIGGINDAISYTVNKYEIDDYSIVSYPENENSIEQILESLSSDVRISLLKWQIGEEALNILEYANSQNFKTSIQAKMPYKLNIN